MRPRRRGLEDVRPLALLAVVTLIGLGIPARTSSAQERAGIVVGSPFGNLIVGAHLPLTAHLVIRPDLSFGVTDRSYTSGGGRRNTSLTFGLATLHYLTAPGPRRDYLVPRLTHRITRYDDGEALSQYELSAGYGRQAEVVERFTLWAEAGAALTYSENRFDGRLSETIRAWNAMARLGVILRL